MNDILTNNQEFEDKLSNSKYNNQHYLINGNLACGKTNALISILKANVEKDRGFIFLDGGGGALKNYKKIVYHLRKKVYYINPDNPKNSSSLNLDLNLSDLIEYIDLGSNAPVPPNIKEKNNWKGFLLGFLLSLSKLDLDFDFEEIYNILNDKKSFEKMLEKVETKEIKSNLKEYLSNWDKSKKIFKIITMQLEKINNLFEERILNNNKPTLKELIKNGENLYINLFGMTKTDTNVLNKLLSVKLKPIVENLKWVDKRENETEIYCDNFEIFFNQNWFKILSQAKKSKVYFRMTFNTLENIKNINNSISKKLHRKLLKAYNKARFNTTEDILDLINVKFYMRLNNYSEAENIAQRIGNIKENNKTFTIKPELFLNNLWEHQGLLKVDNSNEKLIGLAEINWLEEPKTNFNYKTFKP